MCLKNVYVSSKTWPKSEQIGREEDNVSELDDFSGSVARTSGADLTIRTEK